MWHQSLKIWWRCTFSLRNSCHSCRPTRNMVVIFYLNFGQRWQKFQQKKDRVVNRFLLLFCSGSISNGSAFCESLLPCYNWRVSTTPEPLKHLIALYLCVFTWVAFQWRLWWWPLLFKSPRIRWSKIRRVWLSAVKF